MEGASAVVTLSVAVLALVVAIAALMLTIRRGRQQPAAAGSGARASELERRLGQVAQRLEVVESELDAGAAGQSVAPGGAGSTLRTAGVALSHVGLVRFDAFHDTGGAQSFALALIDDDGDGIVLTSLHSRQTTRLFVKGIRRGVADLPLSAEEAEAMRSAGIVPGM
jgi:hypothetical protein